MQQIYAAKQVGDLSYFVEDLYTLRIILDTQKIRQSNKQEHNDRTGSKDYYVSFGRSMTSATIKNAEKWKYGLIIDGDFLSNRYHIEPFSYMGSNLNKQRKLPIATMTSYDDGSAYLKFVNWTQRIPIPMKMFEQIKQVIESRPDVQSKYKYTYQQGGSRKIGGKMIDEKIAFKTKFGDGGFIISDPNFPAEIKTYLMKSTYTNEQEERVWADGSRFMVETSELGSQSFLNIAGCIKGLILPKSEIPDIDNTDDEDIADIRDILYRVCKSPKIIYYSS